MRAQIRRITRLRRATTEHLLDDGLHVTILVAWLPLLEGLPVIAEDLLEGVFVDPLACGDHSARLYHVLAAEASRFFALLSPSLPIASPVGAGRIRDLKKGNSYTLKLTPCGRTFSSATCQTLLSPHTCKPVSASWVRGVSPSLPTPALGGSLWQGPYRPRLMACNSS